MVSRKFANAVSRITKKLSEPPKRFVLKRNLRTIEKLERKRLLRGERTDGKKITPKYRNNSYAKKKASKNSKPGFGTPDLKLTGKAHKSLTASFEGNKVVTRFTASDDYIKQLPIKYENAVGEVSNATTQEVLKENIVPSILKELLKPFTQ